MVPNSILKFQLAFPLIKHIKDIVMKGEGLIVKLIKDAVGNFQVSFYQIC